LIEVAQYTGKVKEAYDFGYASFLGIYNSVTNSYTAGCSLQSTVSASRRGSAIAYTAIIAEDDRDLLAAAYASANGASESARASALQAAVNKVITDAYRNAEIPPATVSAITNAAVSLAVSGITAGYGYINQAVTFSSTVDYSNADTKRSYDKGYGSFLGIYSSGSYAAGTSVAGIVTSSRRSSTAINWLTVLTCATYDAAYSASSGKDLNTLKAAIQSIIDSEYPPGTAATPSAMSSISDALAASCGGGDDGLSGGDIAGIVIGSIFGFALIVVIIYFLAFKKSSDSSEEPKATETFTNNPITKEEKANDQVIADNTVRV